MAEQQIPRVPNPAGYIGGALVTCVTTLVARLMFPFFDPSNLIMVYLLGVMIVATLFGLGPSIAASLLSVAAFDFFFVHPYLTFAVADTQYVVTLAVMLSVAILISTLATQVRQHARAASESALAAETERLRNVLLSSLSHDLRTPLATITGASSSLLEGVDSLPAETRRELTQVVLEESERLSKLVNNLLDMTRLELGSISVQKDWQPLEEVIGSALNRLEKQLEGRQVTVSLPGDLALVPLDAVLIEQVLVNLLENAIKYTPKGSPIDLSATIEKDQATIVLSDRGPGIPSGDESSIFGKFFRGTHSHDVQGVGLGLTVCQGIVTAHGGTIKVENRDGGGAAFHITLPIEGDAPKIIEEKSEGETASE